MRGKSGVTGAAALLAALLATFLWLNMLAGPWRLASGLADAKTQLSKAQKALSAGTTKEARYEALAARASVRRAQAGLDSHSPLLALAEIIPKVRDALSQVPHFVSAARYSSDAAIGTLNIAQNVLRGPDKVIVKTKGGSQIRLDRVQAIGRTVGTVLEDIDKAKQQLQAVVMSKIPHRFRHAVADGIKKANKTQKLLAKARSGTQVDFSIGLIRAGSQSPRVETVTLTAR